MSFINWPQLTRTPDKKALALLRRHLNTYQRDQLSALGYFDENVKWPNRPFFARLHNVPHGLVEVVGQTFCLVPTVVMPAADETLAKLLLLQANPDMFFQLAARTGHVRHLLDVAPQLLAPGYKG